MKKVKPITWRCRRESHWYKQPAIFCCLVHLTMNISEYGWAIPMWMSILTHLFFAVLSPSWGGERGIKEYDIMSVGTLTSPSALPTLYQHLVCQCLHEGQCVSQSLLRARQAASPTLPQRHLLYSKEAGKNIEMWYFSDALEKNSPWVTYTCWIPY